eukprot:Hpha_TRINITY_DN15094_c1_g9::TRINITY_DN15094_c1_g9_i1::g.123764::m.123764/K16365/SGTA; small glutamine-rich tetratricopeptide repeat-containing protein alpha
MSEGPTDVQKRIVVSFIKLLDSSSFVQEHQREVAADLLKNAFQIDDIAKFETSETLEDIWARGAPKEAAASGDTEVDEKKLKEFLDVLHSKGYFKGVEEGSDEYNVRLEKAKAKFIARSNPYEGMTPDQLKQRGNELMTKGQHKDAVGFYSKAIELDPGTAVYYANRAAAYTHLNQFTEAVRDCEKATAIKPDYSKAYSRLGTAYFYQSKYKEAVEAYKKACDLDPENQAYKADLAAAEQKASQPAVPGMPGGMPGMPPGMDFGAVSEMMNNPQFMQMAQNFMQNPEFSKLVQNMAMNMGMGGAGGQPPDLSQLFAGQQPGAGAEGADGMVPTPFGGVHKDALERLQNDPKIKDNPKFQAIQEEVKKEGPSAILKHMNDPEVMAAMTDFSRLFSAQGAAGAPPGVDDHPAGDSSLN